jgi:hypothetical protein
MSRKELTQVKVELPVATIDPTFDVSDQSGRPSASASLVPSALPLLNCGGPSNSSSFFFF